MVDLYKIIENRSPDLCLLCGELPPNRAGHFHPRLVSRFIGKLLGSQKLRFSGAPLKSYQDTIKVPFLCDFHEQEFGGYEKYFSERMLRPYFRDSSQSFSYDATLYAFLLSQAWRALAIQSLISDWDDTPEFIKNRLSQWGEILHRRNFNSGPSVFLVLARDIGENRTEKHPFLTKESLTLDVSHFIDYVPKGRSGLDWNKAFVYAQLGPFHVFAFLGEADDIGEVGDACISSHRIANSYGTLVIRSEISDELFNVIFRGQWAKALAFSGVEVGSQR